MIKKLSEAFGVSGIETDVRNIIIQGISNPEFNIKIDNMGNVIASNKYKENLPTLIIASNMDETGLIITDITDDGYLKFDTVGSINITSLISKTISINGQIGIISKKAIHLTTKKEREVPVKIGELLIDIGAKSKTEAEEYVTIGDYCNFDTKLEEMGKGFIKGKALCRSIGCSAIIDLINKNIPFNLNLIAIFTVQKEISSRGMHVAINNIKCGDVAIILDSFDAECKKGGVIALSAETTSKERTLADYIMDNADKNDIPYQVLVNTEKTNFDSIRLSNPDISSIVLGIPCKYNKTHINVVSNDDINSLNKLIALAIRGVKDGIYK